MIDYVNTNYANMPRKDNLDPAPANIYLLANNISKVNSTGIETEHWYIGTAADIEDRLFNFHGLKRTDLYFARQVRTVMAATACARYLRACTSADGRFDEPEPDADYIYAYPVTATSIQHGPLPPSDGTRAVIVVSLPRLSELAIQDAMLVVASDEEMAAFRKSYIAYLPQFLQWIRDPIESAGLAVDFTTDESATEVVAYRGDPAKAALARRTMERMSFRFATCIDSLRKRDELLDPAEDGTA